MKIEFEFDETPKDLPTGLTYGQLLAAVGQLAASVGRKYYSIEVKTTMPDGPTGKPLTQWTCYIDGYTYSSNGKGAGQRTPEEALEAMIQIVKCPPPPKQMTAAQVEAATVDARVA